jgi:hypothetical protein
MKYKICKRDYYVGDCLQSSSLVMSCDRTLFFDEDVFVAVEKR